MTSATDTASGGGTILVLNGGSSSIKFALYRGDAKARIVAGDVAGIGHDGTVLRVVEEPGARRSEESCAGKDHLHALTALVDWLDAHGYLATVVAVGHRVVHGMAHAEPTAITPELLDELRGLAPIDPDHLPVEIEMIEHIGSRCPELPQVACFDTAFHRTMPRVAQQLPIPRRYDERGIRRYGFHGLSYAYLMEELARRTDGAASRERVVLAHLGSGASMAAVRNGASIDTSMGFTPTAGLPMATRSGDLDPGVAAWLARTEDMSPAAFFAMTSHESGLLGVSATSDDMRVLLDREADDPRAAEAVALFCYQAKKCVGAYAAALGGVDALVFAGGIGEHAATVRARVCDGLGFLGIALDAARNAAHAEIVSTGESRVTVWVIATDEESMIARSVARTLHLER